jgi:hypothetical protein
MTKMKKNLQLAFLFPVTADTLFQAGSVSKSAAR